MSSSLGHECTRAYPLLAPHIVHFAQEGKSRNAGVSKAEKDGDPGRDLLVNGGAIRSIGIGADGIVLLLLKQTRAIRLAKRKEREVVGRSEAAVLCSREAVG